MVFVLDGDRIGLSLRCLRGEVFVLEDMSKMQGGVCS